MSQGKLPGCFVLYVVVHFPNFFIASKFSGSSFSFPLLFFYFSFSLGEVVISQVFGFQVLKRLNFAANCYLGRILIGPAHEPLQTITGQSVL